MSKAIDNLLVINQEEVARLRAENGRYEDLHVEYIKREIAFKALLREAREFINDELGPVFAVDNELLKRIDETLGEKELGEVSPSAHLKVLPLGRKSE